MDKQLEFQRLGTEARKKQGLHSADRVYGFIKEHPGCSIYGISKGLAIEPGSTGKIVERLEVAGRIKCKKAKIEKGRFKWEIYAK